MPLARYSALHGLLRRAVPLSIPAGEPDRWASGTVAATHARAHLVFAFRFVGVNLRDVRVELGLLVRRQKPARLDELLVAQHVRAAANRPHRIGIRATVLLECPQRASVVAELRTIRLLEFFQCVLLRVVEADVLERRLERGHVLEPLFRVAFGNLMVLATIVIAAETAAASASHPTHASHTTAATGIALCGYDTRSKGKRGRRDAPKRQQSHPSHRSILPRRGIWATRSVAVSQHHTPHRALSFGSRHHR